jgi:predicted chitinase
MSTAVLLAGCGGNNGNSLPSVVPSSSGQAKQSVGSTPAPTLPPCTSTSTYYVAGALEWPTCQSDPSPTPSATPIIVACNPSTIGTASYMRGLKSVCVPTPAPTQTPSVKILSLSLAGTHSNVNNLLQPTTDQGHFTLTIIPASGAPTKIFGGQRLGGTYTDAFSCWKLPQGAYTGVSGVWTIGQNYQGSLQEAFTIPSQALLQKIASAARGGQLTAAAQKALPYLFKAFAKDNITDPNQMAAIVAEIDHEDNFGSFNGGVESISQTEANAAYDGRMGNGPPGSSDGYTYRGRGYVQVTGRANYQTFANKYGIDVVDNPGLLLSYPDLDAQNAVDSIVKGSFTGAKLSTYVNANTVDFYDARRTVNGIDHAYVIKQYSQTYAGILGGGC